MFTTEHAIANINQIARNFDVLGTDDAVRATADHVRLFWAPLRRDALVEVLHQDPDRLSPVARKAAALATSPAASKQTVQLRNLAPAATSPAAP